MGTQTLDQAIRQLPGLIELSPHIWIDYDAEADVLYVSFRRPQQARDSRIEGATVVHVDGDTVVGLTVIGFKSGWNEREDSINASK